MDDNFLAFHVYEKHLGFAPNGRKCYCGEYIYVSNYQEHFFENGGAFSHYHAVLLGARP